MPPTDLTHIHANASFLILSLAWYIPALATTPSAAILALLIGVFQLLPAIALPIHFSGYEVDVLKAVSAFKETPTCDLASHTAMMQVKMGDAVGLLWAG